MTHRTEFLLDLFEISADLQAIWGRTLTETPLLQEGYGEQEGEIAEELLAQLRTTLTQTLTQLDEIHSLLTEHYYDRAASRP